MLAHAPLLNRSRDSLASEMATYQELFAEDGGVEDGPHAGDLAAGLQRIEALRLTAEAEVRDCSAAAAC